MKRVLLTLIVSDEAAERVKDIVLTNIRTKDRRCLGDVLNDDLVKDWHVSVEHHFDNAKVEQLVEKLELVAERKPDAVQYEMDEVIYDYLGTGEQSSSINNQGFAGQVEALAMNLEWNKVEEIVNSVCEKFKA